MGKAAEKQPKTYTGLEALLVFPNHEDHKDTVDLMRRFSSALRYGYQRLLEGKDRKALKREDGLLCNLFRLNTRYADDALLKAQSLISSLKERGEDPRKVVCKIAPTGLTGGRKLHQELSRFSRSNRPLYREKKAEWEERRKGMLYARGDKTKGGNLNLRLVIGNGSLCLRINLVDRYAHALVKTSHPRLQELLGRVYAGDPYNVELSLRKGKVYALFSWEEELPPLRVTKEQGILALDINSDPYHLALAIVNPDGNLRRYLTLSLEEVDKAPNRGAKEILLWQIAHQVVGIAMEEEVAIATERLKHLPKGRRGDGSGRHFRRKAHRFAYRSLLKKVHTLARRKGIQSLEVNPKDTSTIGMLKYAPLLSLSKDVAAAYVIGRRALGFKEEIPKNLRALLGDSTFHQHARRFYGERIAELQDKYRRERNPYLKRRLGRELKEAKRALAMILSSQGEPGSPKGSTNGRNPQGNNPWRALRVGTFLPLLGRRVPRDLSPLKPILLGSWEGWKGGSGPHPQGMGFAHDGGGPAAMKTSPREEVGSGG
ncbi:IS200/IS605 family accessory protein TnpB-related protein [Thermus amyloliquefaciens]|uniref:IS200/IS605 family accessory protein TnpB-related protein n=1 Tax=Thermus amyloliquefaciens TaxID=1449080 RepID=UPI000B11D620|nr:IS200/IS605 family accessory protein TnpB-related protein [Thermus amyloliquefaciens]